MGHGFGPFYATLCPVVEIIEIGNIDVRLVNRLLEVVILRVAVIVRSIVVLSNYPIEGVLVTAEVYLQYG